MSSQYLNIKLYADASIFSVEGCAVSEIFDSVKDFAISNEDIMDEEAVGVIIKTVFKKFDLDSSYSVDLTKHNLKIVLSESQNLIVEEVVMLPLNKIGL